MENMKIPQDSGGFWKPELACSEATGLGMALGFNPLVSSLLGILLQPKGPEILQQPVKTSCDLAALAEQG